MSSLCSSVTDDASTAKKCSIPSKLKIYLPKFVKEARRIQAFDMFRDACTDAVEFTVRFTASTDQAQRDFQRLQKVNSVRQPQRKVAVDVVQCDGPCQRYVFPEDVVQFGDCDHNVCCRCLKAGRRRLYDGSPSCCAKACLKSKESLKSYNSKAQSSASSRKEKSDGRRRRRQNVLMDPETSEFIPGERSSTKKSSKKRSSKKKEKKSEQRVAISVDSGGRSTPIFSVLLCVFWLDRNRNLQRESIEMDLLDDAPLSATMDRARNFISSGGGASGEDDLDRIKWYYTPKHPFDRSDLQPMDSSQLARKTAGQLVGSYDKLLTIVAVSPGTAI